MQTPHPAGVLFGLALLVVMTGHGTVPRLDAKRVPSQQSFVESRALSHQRERAFLLFQSQKYVAAAQEYRKGFEDARRLGEPRSALRFLNSVGAAELAGLEYRASMRTLFEVRRLAGEQQDWEMSGVAALNLASLYLQIPDISAASRQVGFALDALADVPGSRYQAQALALDAKLRAWNGDLERALPEFSAAIRAADAQGDTALKAQLLGQLGYESLKRGRLQQADCALTESFRLRVLSHSASLAQAYRSLAMLRMAQGDFDAAEVLIGRAIALSREKPGRMPEWALLQVRGQLRLAQHRPAEAVADLRQALVLARSWWLASAPADSLQASAELRLQEPYLAFVRAALEVYFRTGREQLAREAFAASEEVRVLSLRAALARDACWYGRMPDEYGRTLSQLRLARASLMRQDTAVARAQIEKLEGRLAELEAVEGGASAGLDAGENPDFTREVASRLGPSDALVSFQLDDPRSYAWVVTSGGFRVYRLAGARELRGQVRAFTEAVRTNAPDAVTRGEQLFAELFGAGMPLLQGKRRWLVSADDVLLGVPFPALVVARRENAPVFLAERHAVTIVPGASLLGTPAGAGDRNCGLPARAFVGVADPIYNHADERNHAVPSRATFELPRLMGTASEVSTCARAWSRAPATLLEGASANRAALARAMAGGPAVIHFATHVVESREDPGRRLIPLSLGEGDEPELIGPEEIRSWRLPHEAVVVLSGCASGVPERRVASGVGAAAPFVWPTNTDSGSELGMVGLARAWLAAGARSVVVTLWPMPDGDGEIFTSFYTHLRASGGPDAAVALARAQVDMLNTQTWRSIPKHWAAYLTVGRGN